MRLDLPSCRVQRTADVWAEKAPHYWSFVKRGEETTVALYNAAALVAVLLHYDEVCEDNASDLNNLGNLLYEPYQRLAHVITMLQQLPEEIESITAVHILQQLLLPENKNYIGAAHVIWVRSLRLKGMYNYRGWASDLPMNFAKDYQGGPRRSS